MTVRAHHEIVSSHTSTNYMNHICVLALRPLFGIEGNHQIKTAMVNESL